MEPNRTVKRAKPPFNRDDADIILRSKDHVDFYLHRQFLTVASPFFTDLFSLKQPLTDDGQPHATLNGKRVPIIHLTETDLVLDSLFRILYPTEWSPGDILSMADTLGAARKYQIEYAERKLRGLLFDNLETEPMAVYAVACALGIEDTAAKAASTLRRQARIESVSLKLPYHPSMNGRVSAGQYHRLLQHCRCHTAVKTFIVHDPSPGSGKPKTAKDRKPDFIGGLKDLDDLQLFPPNILDVNPSGRIPSDIIVRSSDGHHFATHIFILRLASPMLSELVDSPDLPIVDDRPCLKLDVDGKVLRQVLERCYPYPPWSIQDLDALTAIADAAKKYKIIGLVNLARNCLVHVAETSSDALRAFCIAVFHGWREEAQKVGEIFGKLPNGTTYAYGPDAYRPEMELIPAWPYRCLLLYLRDCLNCLQRSDPAVLLSLMTLNQEVDEALSSAGTFDPGF
ncbi:hypothetical protein NLI96_g11344 [Meripilus lineatus]|uniref:BTB domain-containing protein n=1 Tax=Meripilus lineatus TaxID=2056292 RepID=A0AAD5URY5_9APHY|nr:hypothetical protein NLI96_g11344 [Physisporinus lineatus]